MTPVSCQLPRADRRRVRSPRSGLPPARIRARRSPPHDSRRTVNFVNFPSREILSRLPGPAARPPARTRVGPWRL